MVLKRFISAIAGVFCNNNFSAVCSTYIATYTSTYAKSAIKRFRALCVICLVLVVVDVASAFTLPENFSDTAVLQNLQDTDGFAFSPDGRIFISERITGKLRVAKYNSSDDSWSLNPLPFYTFDIPKDGNGQPQARRSAGLRDIAFDPDFENNGFVYAFYMKNGGLHNRVVRIKASDENPDLADAGEFLVIDLPFNDSQSSGSHNGGALEFGTDNKLYITTGDGWEGEFAGDSVQSFSSFTGKVLRINTDGSIPGDNPFLDQAEGDYEAIYALGLRNPYSMSQHPDTGALYINEARGNNKASIYIVEAGANYQHEGSNTGFGTDRDKWADASLAGGELVTGGAWLPEAGLANFPAAYDGRYFVALWGSNSSTTGRISTIVSDSDTSVSSFATGVGLAGSNGIAVKPVITRFSDSGELFYMLTTYTTSSAEIRRVRFTQLQTAATPTFNPAGTVSLTTLNVVIESATSDASIRYTTDNSSPDENSPLYSGPIAISESTIVRARAFKEDFNPSSEASAVYIIGDQSGNLPPIVDAGSDSTRFVGQTITLDGSATTDPDGDDDFLSDEQWTLVSGPAVDILDATEEIAFFRPIEPGVYRFQLSVSDGIVNATDDVVHTVVVAPRVSEEPVVLYTFLEGGGSQINDLSTQGDPLNLTIADSISAELLENGGLEISGTTSISSTGAAKIINACTSANEITLETWLTPESVNQSGPARILSLSTDTLNRNFTLGQENDRFDVRLRTTDTNSNGVPSLTVPASTVKQELTHVVYTRASDASAIIYINGVPQVVGTVSGQLSNWNNSYNFMLANEATGDRDWQGELYLVAIYCTALDIGQVAQNFAAGIPPFSEQSDEDDDDIIDLIDNCPSVANSDQADLDSDGVGDVCDSDRDNDGVINNLDDDPNDNAICQDVDEDGCNDCAVGQDGYGPLPDFLVANDGDDFDQDGICDDGDMDDDNDMVDEPADNCPYLYNPSQYDGNGNGIGEACDPSERVCYVIKTRQGKIANFCL